MFIFIDIFTDCNFIFFTHIKQIFIVCSFIFVVFFPHSVIVISGYLTFLTEPWFVVFGSLQLY